MQRASFFIENKALFGSFPTQKSVDELESHGVKIFIDLTCENEAKTCPYTTKYTYIRYPIKDQEIPEDSGPFASFILKLTDLLRNCSENNKMYIHCKGGHGRAGIVVACILCCYYGIGPKAALKITNVCHSIRPQMNDKWRKLGAPQTSLQKEFVFKFFKTLPYDATTNCYGFENSENFPVELVINNKTYVFQNASLAVQKIIELMPLKWKYFKEKYMYTILHSKFNQNPELKRNLLQTGLRYLLNISDDNFWGSGKNMHGKNIHGKLLVQLRNELYNRSTFKDYEKF